MILRFLRPKTILIVFLLVPCISIVMECFQGEPIPPNSADTSVSTHSNPSSFSDTSMTTTHSIDCEILFIYPEHESVTNSDFFSVISISSSETPTQLSMQIDEQNAQALSYDELLTLPVNNLTPGLHAIKIQMEFPNNQLVQSEVHFTVIPNSPELNLIDECSNLPLFSWSSVDFATGYEFTIYNSLNAPILTETIDSDTNFQLTVGLEEGMYYWEIVSLVVQGSDIIRSMPSSQQSFEVYSFDGTLSLDQPLDNQTFCNSVIDLDWSVTGTIEDHTLQISEQSDFQTLLIEETNVAVPYSIPANTLSPGSYFWRVKISISEDPCPYYSSAKQFHYGSTIPSFELLFPEDNRNDTHCSPVTFQWQSAANAENYQIVLKEGATTIIDKTVTDTQFTPDNRLPNGTYSWSVTAKNSGGCIQISTSTFTLQKSNQLITNIDTPTSIVLDSSTGMIYYSSFQSNYIKKVHKSGGPVTTVIDTLYYSVGSISICDQRLYFTQVEGYHNGGNGAILKTVENGNWAVPSFAGDDVIDDWFSHNSNASSSGNCLDWNIYLRCEQEGGDDALYWSQIGGCERGLFKRAWDAPRYTYQSAYGSRPHANSGCANQHTDVYRFTMDDTYIYFVTYLGTGGTARLINRALKSDLSNLQTLLTESPPYAPFSLTVDDTYIYFTDHDIDSSPSSGRIGKINKAILNQTQADIEVLVETSGVDKPIDLLLDSNQLYYLAGEVYSIPVTGGTAVALTTGLNQVSTEVRGGPLMVADTDAIYVVVNAIPSTHGFIQRICK